MCGSNSDLHWGHFSYRLRLTNDADATSPIWYKHVCADCITLKRKSVKNPVRRHMVLPDTKARKASMTIQRNAEAVAHAYAAHTVRLGSLLYAEISKSLLLLGSMSHYRMRCTECMDS
jgi:hypothetical protein